jgi:hypothetical protein
MRVSAKVRKRATNRTGTSRRIRLSAYVSNRTC